MGAPFAPVQYIVENPLRPGLQSSLNPPIGGTMKLPQFGGLVLAMILLFSCATPGGLTKSGNRITVAYGPEVLQDKDRLEVFQDLRVVEYVHQYVSRELKGDRLRKPLEIDITITAMMLRMSSFNKAPSRMHVEVVVREGDQELTRYRESYHTRENSIDAVRKMSDAFAEDVADRVKKESLGDSEAP